MVRRETLRRLCQVWVMKQPAKCSTDGANPPRRSTTYPEPPPGRRGGDGLSGLALGGGRKVPG